MWSKPGDITSALFAKLFSKKALHLEIWVIATIFSLSDSIPASPMKDSENWVYWVTATCILFRNVLPITHNFHGSSLGVPGRSHNLVLNILSIQSRRDNLSKTKASFISDFALSSGMSSNSAIVTDYIPLCLRGAWLLILLKLLSTLLLIHDFLMNIGWILAHKVLELSQLALVKEITVAV